MNTAWHFFRKPLAPPGQEITDTYLSAELFNVVQRQNEKKNTWNFLFRGKKMQVFCPIWTGTRFKCCRFPLGGNCVFQITVPMFPYVLRGRCLELSSPRRQSPARVSSPAEGLCPPHHPSEPSPSWVTWGTPRGMEMKVHNGSGNKGSKIMIHRGSKTCVYSSSCVVVESRCSGTGGFVSQNARVCWWGGS